MRSFAPTRKRSAFLRRILVLVLALIALPIVALAGPINSTSQGTFAGAQNVNSAFTLDSLANVQDSTTISHVEISQLGRPGAGYDFYTFSHGGGTVHLDVDTISTATNFDTEIGIWDTAGNLLGASDDNGNDVGDGPGLVGGAFNSAIFNLNLASGDYIVGVAAFNSSFQTGAPFITGNSVPTGGTYTLNISANNGVTVVPEPTTLALLGSGILTLGAMGWRRIRKS